MSTIDGTKRWLQSEAEHEALKPWILCDEGIWMDRNLMFWFVDETEANSYGPYPTAADAVFGAAEYGASL